MYLKCKNKPTRELTATMNLTSDKVHFRLKNFDTWLEEELYLQIEAPQVEYVDLTH